MAQNWSPKSLCRLQVIDLPYKIYMCLKYILRNVREMLIILMFTHWKIDQTQAFTCICRYLRR